LLPISSYAYPARKPRNAHMFQSSSTSGMGNLKLQVHKGLRALIFPPSSCAALLAKMSCLTVAAMKCPCGECVDSICGSVCNFQRGEKFLRQCPDKCYLRSMGPCPRQSTASLGLLFLDAYPMRQAIRLPMGTHLYAVEGL
jgi:hypothetical protein